MNSGFEINHEKFILTHFTSKCIPRDIGGDHCHDQYEITYLLNASGRYIVEGGEYLINAGTLLLINPMTYHRVEIDCVDNIEGYSIRFSRRLLPESAISLLDSISNNGDMHGRYYTADRISDSVISAFDRFEIARDVDENQREVLIQAILSEMIVLISVSNGEGMIRREDELGARVVKYLNANIDKSISLDRLARRFFVSKYHLCRAFKKYAGTTVHAYVNYKRIIFAKGLIESGMTASSAAERVGFGDYSAFYRAFVKIVGKSPTA